MPRFSLVSRLNPFASSPAPAPAPASTSSTAFIFSSADAPPPPPIEGDVLACVDTLLLDVQRAAARARLRGLLERAVERERAALRGHRDAVRELAALRRNTLANARWLLASTGHHLA